MLLCGWRAPQAKIGAPLRPGRRILKPERALQEDCIVNGDECFNFPKKNELKDSRQILKSENDE